MDASNNAQVNEKLLGANQDYWLHLAADTQLNKYPAKQHARAVATKLGVTNGIIFLRGEKIKLLKDSDQPIPFRQRRYFYYLTGCNEADCAVTYDISKDLLTLFIPPIDVRHAVWGGAGSTKAEAYEKYDVDLVEYKRRLGYCLDERLDAQPGTKIFGIEHLKFSGCRRTHVEKWEKANAIDLTELKSAIELCRVIKDPHEIQLIRKANEISARAHRAVLEEISTFKNERQVEGLFLDTCISAGAHNQAYEIIAGAGTNAAVLHYVANNSPISNKQLILLDAGAEYQCYASDVTRTFPISGHWSAEQKSIYDIVDDMQRQCISRIKPGVHFRDLQVLAAAIATQGLLSLGVLHNGTVEEILKAGTIQAFFPHGLGHHVGLEVHDVLHVPIQSKSKPLLVDRTTLAGTILETVASDAMLKLYESVIGRHRCQSLVFAESPALEADMIVTVEPGIYFSKFALSRVFLPDPVHAKFINKTVLGKYMLVGGVRIEDDILVTKRGYENLTTAPKGEEALRIIRGETKCSGMTKDAPSTAKTAHPESPPTTEAATDILPPRGDATPLMSGFPFRPRQPDERPTQQPSPPEIAIVSALVPTNDLPTPLEHGETLSIAEAGPQRLLTSDFPNPILADERQPKYLKVLHSYEASDALKITRGELLKLVLQSSKWWFAQRTGVQSNDKGWVPSNYVSILTKEEYEREEHNQKAILGKEVENAARLQHQILQNELDREQKQAIRGIFCKDQLRFIFCSDLIHQVKQNCKSDLNEADTKLLQGKLEAPRELACFAGFCMKMRLLLGAKFDISALPGQGMQKLRGLHMSLDRRMKDPEGPYRIFHRMSPEESRRILKWTVIGFKDEVSDEVGTCMACHLCRAAYAAWDTNWLSPQDDDKEEECESDDDET